MIKERDREHYIDSIVYLMEQTAICCKYMGEQIFKEAGLGINADQYAVLDTISINQSIHQSDLARLLLKDRSYTSRILDTLEEMNFIERKIETKGKRLVKRVYTTEKGMEMLKSFQEKLKPHFNKLIEEIEDDAMTEEDMILVRRGLEKIKNCISKHTKIPL